jgi:hypothetical protein
MMMLKMAVMNKKIMLVKKKILKMMMIMMIMMKKGSLVLTASTFRSVDSLLSVPSIICFHSPGRLSVALRHQNADRQSYDCCERLIWSIMLWF